MICTDAERARLHRVIGKLEQLAWWEEECGSDYEAELARADAECLRAMIAQNTKSTAPDPVCANPECGHPQSCHYSYTEECDSVDGEDCYCKAFVPTAEPEPDPVLVDEIAALIANRVLHPNEVFMTGPYRVPSEERRCKEAAQEIVYMLTNGRDGSR